MFSTSETMRGDAKKFSPSSEAPHRKAHLHAFLMDDLSVRFNTCLLATEAQRTETPLSLFSFLTNEYIHRTSFRYGEREIFMETL